MDIQAYENVQVIEVNNNGVQSINFNAEDVQSVVQQDTNEVLLLLKSGQYVLLTNTDNITSSGVIFQFSNGQDFSSLDLASLSSSEVSSSETVENTPPSSSALLTAQEEESQAVESLEPIDLGFNSDDVSAYEFDADSNLIVTLKDGQQVVLEGVSENATLLVEVDGQAIQASEIYSYLQNNVSDSDLADAATQAAQQEPAAGDAANAGTGAQNTGFTFQEAGLSALGATPDAIGAIGPTALTNTAPVTSNDPVPDIDPDTGEFIFADVPNLTVNVDGSDAEVYEDGSVYVPIEASLTDTDGSETLSLTITGIPTGWTLTGAGWTAGSAAGTYEYNGLAPAEAYSGGVTLTPPADSDVDLSDLTVIATATETSGVTAQRVESIDVIVDAVADVPSLDAQNVTGQEDEAIALDIDAVVTDTDGSENITSVVISGVPTGYSLSAGTDDGNGNWTLTPAQLAGVTISSPADTAGVIQLTVTAYSAETITDQDFDSTNDTAFATDTFTVQWAGDADTPNLTVNTDGSDAEVLEDGSVYVPVTASTNDADGSETLSLTVSGIPSGWTLTGTGWTAGAVAGTYEYNGLNPGEAYAGGFTLTPPADSDVDMLDLTVTATATETNGDTEVTQQAINVIVDAVADAPDVDAQDTSGDEDTALALDIDASVTDLDGSESITSVVISGVPTGFSLSAGTNNGSGTWTLSPSDLAGLTISSPANYNGSIPLTVTVTASENPSDTETTTSNNTATASDSFTVTWNGGADTPNLTVNTDGSDAEVYEDGSVFVPITASSNDTTGSETLTLTVTGIPSGWAFAGTGWTAGTVAGTYVYNGLSAGEDYTGGFTLTPPADSDVDLTGLTVTVTATETNGDSASKSDTIDVIVDAVADTPDVDGSNVSGVEDSAIALDIDALATDTDGSESISSVTISGVPNGFSLSAGTNNGNGSWTLSAAQLTGLTISAPTDYTGSIDLTVTATASENTSDAEITTGNNTASDSDTFTVTWTPQADPPSITVNTDGSDAEVLEDGSVYVPVTASTNDADGSETLSLTVTGVPSGWTLTGTGWTAGPGAGTYVYTGLNPGEDYTGGFTLTPPADSDVDLTTLTVTATSTDTNGDTATTSDTIDVIVDAVADDADVDADDTSGLENTALAVDIDAAVTDTDGSESISAIEISGVPNGFSLSAGTDNGNGTWTLSEGDLSGLTISSPTDYVGSIPLTVTVISSENPTDSETTTSNNTASVTDTFTATWIDTPEFIVGDNPDETLTGGQVNDIIVGDTGGTITTQPDKDYNLNIIIDVTGSLEDEFAMIQAAVNSLLEELSDYDGGTINVNIIPFVPVVSDGSGGYANGSITAVNADVTSNVNALTNYVDSLNAYGATNIESVLVEATDIIENNSIDGATTYTMVLTDAIANAYTDDNGAVQPTPYIVDPSPTQNELDGLGQINGTDDGTNEIAMLQATSDYVFGVMVGGYGWAQEDLLQAVDSDGIFDTLDDNEDLDAYSVLFQEAAEVTTLAEAGDDTINGDSGDDIIFGDVLFTDDLADAYGLSTEDGAGFAVFEALENANNGWDRADTIAYIEANAEALSEESTLNGEGREGGNDILNGGAGDDLIFGQEGDDIINGGSGSDDLYGGSGADTFIFTATDGDVDTIYDFSIADGDALDVSSLISNYDDTQDAITDFLRVTQNGDDTVVSVNVDGIGSDWMAVATLTDVDLGTNEAQLVGNGTIIV